MKKLNIWAHVICMCLISSNSYSKISKFDVYQVAKKEFTLGDVCQTLLKKNYPLIQAHSQSQVDCMSTIVDVTTFCETKLAADPYLIRGFVENAKAYCQSATRVILKYSCESKSDEYCKDSSIGCYKLKDKLAKRLKTVHHSIIDKKELNCYFSANN